MEDLSVHSIDALVMGEPLSGIGRRGYLRADPMAETAYRRMLQQRLGSASQRSARAFLGNVGSKPQSVVKRIVRGGTRNAQQLARQLNYITRENTVKSWASLSGMGVAEISENDVPRLVSHWSAGWRGNPKHGHTDHILLSFPSGTNAKVAQEISEEWGEQMFGEGTFGDTWQYVAAFHEDKDHPHAHFVVNKFGFFEREWLSISNRGHMDFDTMREFHAEIANEYGVEMVASSRFSRGIVEPGADQSDYRNAMREGRGVASEVFTEAKRAKANIEITVFIKSYENLAASAIAAAKSALENPDYNPQVASEIEIELYNLADTLVSAANSLKEGNKIMTPKDVVSVEAATTTVDEYMAKRSLMEQRIDQTYDGIQEMNEGPAKQEALGLLVATITDTDSELTKIFPDHPVIRAYSIGVEGQDAYKTLTMGVVRDVKRSGRDTITIKAVEERLGDLRQKLVNEVPGSDGNTGLIIERMLEGGAGSQGQHDDWKRADVLSYLENMGETRETAPAGLIEKAEQWFGTTTAQLRAAIDTDTDIVPIGLLANVAAEHYANGGDVGGLQDRLPALKKFVDEVSENQVTDIYNGDLSSLETLTSDRAAQNALAAEIVTSLGARNSEELVLTLKPSQIAERAEEFLGEARAVVKLREQQEVLKEREQSAVETEL